MNPPGIDPKGINKIILIFPEILAIIVLYSMTKETNGGQDAC